MTDVTITRRTALLGATAGVLAATAPVVTSPALAKAEMKGVSIPVHARFWGTSK